MSNGSGDRRLSEFLDRMIANGDTVYAGVEDWYGTPIVEGEGHYYQWDKNQKLLVLIPDSWTPQLSYRMYSPTGSFTEVQAAEAAFGYPNQEVYRRDPAPKALGRLITAMNKHWLEFEVPNKALEKSGEMWAYITVTSEHHTMTEFIVKIMVLPRVKPEPYQSLNDPDSVAQVLAMLIEARDRAEAAADRSEAAADRSEAAQAAAEAARDAAAASASAAASSATQAASSASSAASSASAAAQSETNASRYAGQAVQAATDAAGYRSQAASSASLASGYANDAKGYRDQAKSYYDSLVNAGTTVTQLSTEVTTLKTKVSTLETCCNEVSDYIPPPFTLSINGSTYGYKDTGGSFHPFKHPSGTLTLTANTGSSGVNTEYGSDGAYYEKVVVDVPEGPGPTTHTTTYTPVAENDSGSGNDMGESHSHRYVNTSGLYKVNQETKTITANTGSAGEDVTHYSKVVVNVPSSGGITPSGTKSITENGTYDVTNYESAAVNVPPDIKILTNSFVVYDYVHFHRREISTTPNGWYTYINNNNTISNQAGTHKMFSTGESWMTGGNAFTSSQNGIFIGYNPTNGNYPATAPKGCFIIRKTALEAIYNVLHEFSVLSVFFDSKRSPTLNGFGFINLKAYLDDNGGYSSSKTLIISPDSGYLHYFYDTQISSGATIGFDDGASDAGSNSQVSHYLVSTKKRTEYVSSTEVSAISKLLFTSR